MNESRKSDVFRQTIDAHKGYIYTTIFLSIFVAYLPVSPIVYMRTVFGPVINSQSLSFLFSLAGLLVLALAVNGILEWIRERVLLSATISFINSLEEKVFNATFEQSQEKWNSGARAFSNMRVLRNFMVSPVSGAFFDAPFSLSLLLVIFFIHPLMGAFSLLSLVVALIIGILIENKVQPEQEAASEKQSQARIELNTLHNNNLYCNSMGNLPHLYKKWFKNQQNFLLFQAKASSMQSLGGSVSQVVMMVQGSMLLGVGTLLTLIGVMDARMAGNLIIAKFIGALAIRPTMMIVMAWSQVISVRQAVTDLRIFLESTKFPKSSGVQLPAPKGELLVRDVTFQQDEKGQKILDSLSFSLSPGNICAVLGESGAGKSTLAKLLVGFYLPSKGAIRLDGVSISTWDKKELCDHIGFLPQELQLFGGGVAENITRFKQIDEQKLKQVCEDFDIMEVFEGLKEGNPLQISDDCLDLPGGFKQRIALARAFYNSPNFIVLDEPTSSLDAQSENRFFEILEKHRNRGALIIINTHNKRILTMANYILALKEGRQKIFDTKENIKKKMNLPL